MPDDTLGSVLNDASDYVNLKSERPSDDQLKQAADLLDQLEQHKDHPDYQVMRDELHSILAAGGITPKSDVQAGPIASPTSNIGGLDNPRFSSPPLVNSDTSLIPNISPLSAPVFSNPPPIPPVSPSPISNPPTIARPNLNLAPMDQQELDNTTRQTIEMMNQLRTENDFNQNRLTEAQTKNPQVTPIERPLTSTKIMKSPKKTQRYSSALTSIKGASRLTGRS